MSGQQQTLAERVWETLSQVDGIITAADMELISDDALAEFLAGCDADDWEVLKDALDDEVLQDLGEALEEDLSELAGDDATLEAYKKKVVRGGKVVTKNLKRVKAGTRRKLSKAASRAGRLRKGKKLSPSTKRKIAKSKKVRKQRSMD